jgi:hypothetical protein
MCPPTLEDVGLRIAENLAIDLLHGEHLLDPFQVDVAKVGGVTLLVVDDL